MKRAANERRRTLSTWRTHLAEHTGNILCACEFQPGRFRKSERVGSCGRSRCWLCHGDKLAGVARHRDLRELVKYREGVNELEFTVVKRAKSTER